MESTGLLDQTDLAGERKRRDDGPAGAVGRAQGECVDDDDDDELLTEVERGVGAGVEGTVGAEECADIMPEHVVVRLKAAL